jgi:hypothetical protein
MLKKMRSYFIGEKLSRLTDHHDQVRAITNYNFSLVLLLGFVVSLIPVFFSDNNEILYIPVFSGFTFSVLILFGNKFIYSAKLLGLIFVIFGLSVAFANLFLNTEVLHLGVPLWILLVLLYSFYNVGALWSIVVASISVSIYVFWIVYYLNDEVQRMARVINEITPIIVLEVTLAFVTLTAMILVYVKAIYSKERQLTLKNKQMRLNQQVVDNQEELYNRAFHHSMKSVHKYFDILSSMSKDLKSSTELNIHFMFASIVSKAISQQGKYRNMDPGALITSVMGVSSATFAKETSEIHYTVDNTVDFIEEEYVFPLCLVLTMLVHHSLNVARADNIAVNYFYDGGYVVLSYRDNGKKETNRMEAVDLVKIGISVLSEVNLKFGLREDKQGTFVDIRMPV